MRRLSAAIGQALREARRDAGLTLRAVGRASRSRFKPSAVGSYERGERAISIDRFCELAAVYGVPPDRLLSRVMELAAPDVRREIVVDLGRLREVTGSEAREAAEFIHAVRARRGDYLSEVITLRAGDVEAIASAAGTRPKQLLQTLNPALRDSQRRG